MDWSSLVSRQNQTCVRLSNTRNTKHVSVVGHVLVAMAPQCSRFQLAILDW